MFQDEEQFESQLRQSFEQDLESFIVDIAEHVSF